MTVLLVDDDESAALLFRLIAEKEGFKLRFQCVDSTQKAIDYLSGVEPFANRRKHPVPELIVLDLLMPGLNGFDLLDWCQGRPELRPIPKVVFSGSTSDSDPEKALAKGAIRFFSKPAALSTLKSVVHDILSCAGRGRPRGREII